MDDQDEQDRLDILKQIGASEKELHDLFQKFNAFLNGLNANQRSLYLNSEVSLRHAAHTLDDVSPEQLRAFLQSFAPKGGVVLRICGRHNIGDVERE